MLPDIGSIARFRKTSKTGGIFFIRVKICVRVIRITSCFDEIDYLFWTTIREKTFSFPVQFLVTR